MDIDRKIASEFIERIEGEFYAFLELNCEEKHYYRKFWNMISCCEMIKQRLLEQYSIEEGDDEAIAEIHSKAENDWEEMIMESEYCDECGVELTNENRAPEEELKEVVDDEVIEKLEKLLERKIKK